MADIGELVVRIKADASQLEREMRRVNTVTQQQTQKISASLGALRSQFAGLIPALSAAAVVGFGRSAVDAAGHIKDLADRIGFASTTLLALRTPLDNSGSSLDEFSASVNRMNNMIGEAARGLNQEAVRAFDQLGLSVRKLQEMSPEEQFYAVTQAIMQLDSQAKIIEAGMNIFGRSFAAMLPLLKEYSGNMREAVEATGKIATKEDIDRLDQFGDALKKTWNDAQEYAIKYLAVLLRIGDWMASSSTVESIFPQSVLAGSAYAQGKAGGSVSSVRPTLSDEDVASKFRAAMGGGSARGSNAGLLKPDKELESATRAYRDYLKAIEDENYLLHINEKERAGAKALLEAQTLAQKAHIKISEEDREKIVGMTNANEDLKKSMEEAARFSQELKDKFSDGLTDIVFGFDGATDAAKRFAEQIARMIVEKKITGPLADALVGTSSGGTGILDDIFGGGGGGGFLSGIGDFFGGFFAEGGRPPMGRPSIVGENGPELFIPDSTGTVVPNGGYGGGVSVTTVINISPGIQGTVQSELNRAIPSIVAAAQNSTLAAIEKGGRAAQIVGKRNG